MVPWAPPRRARRRVAGAAGGVLLGANSFTDMMRVSSFLAASGIHGVGCFTREAIAAGQVVWEFDPECDREFAPEQIARLPAAVREHLGSHAWTSPRGTVLLCADHGAYFNHDDAANTAMTPDGRRCVARRAIAAGEELTSDYAELPGVEAG